MSLDDAVADAIDRAYRVIQDKDFATGSATMFSHNRQTIAGLVRDNEVPDLGLMAVIRGSKRVEMGFAAVMQDRLVLAWQTGFRSRPESRTIPYANVAGLSLVEQGPDRKLGAGPVLTLVCDNGHHEDLGLRPGSLALAKEVAARLDHHCRRIQGA